MKPVQAVIEVPKWSFVKRGSSNRIDFISPLPCPYNYGAIPDRIGLDGDLLDVLILGPRLSRGSRITIEVFGAIGMSERGYYDDKLIASASNMTPLQKRTVLLFFHCYAFCKGILNILRGQRGAFARCTGWIDAQSAYNRSVPRTGSWSGPRVDF